jgi:hypothetical protein
MNLGFCSDSQGGWIRFRNEIYRIPRNRSFELIPESLLSGTEVSGFVITTIIDY